MSEQREARDPSETPGDEPADAADSTSEVGPSEEAGDADGPRGGGALLAGLALVLALAAIGASGWLWWQQRGDAAQADVSARVDELAQRLEDQADALERRDSRAQRVEDRLGELSGSLSDFESRLDAVAEAAESAQGPEVDLSDVREDLSDLSAVDARIEDELASLADRLDRLSDQLQGQVENLQGQTEALQATTDDLGGQLRDLQSRRDTQLAEEVARARFRLGLVEVAGLLRLGLASAESSGGTEEAISAYRRALSRLQDLGDGRADRLRELVSRELETLSAVEPTDWSSVLGGLASLESEASRWPLAGAREISPTSGSEAAVADETQDKDAGWWTDVRRSLGGLVRVTPREAAPLSPASAASIRERLRIHLAAAQAAVSRRSVAELVRHAEAAGSMLNEHFDTEARPVREALDRLSQASSIETRALPDLGAALSEADRLLAES